MNHLIGINLSLFLKNRKLQTNEIKIIIKDDSQINKKYINIIYNIELFLRVIKFNYLWIFIIVYLLFIIYYSS